MRRRRNRKGTRASGELPLLVAGAIAGAGAGAYMGRRFGNFYGFLHRVRVWMRLAESVLPSLDRFDDDSMEERLLRTRLAHGAEWGHDTGEFPAPESDATEEELTQQVDENVAAAANSTPERELEERVLKALELDAVLKRRAVAIEAVGNGAIELSGRVRTNEEAARAAAVARSVLGVAVVLDRMSVRAGGHVETASAPRNPAAEKEPETAG